MTFGELLKRFREERKYTLRDISKLSDIDHAYIYRLETGGKGAPSEEVVTALVKALKLDSRRARILKFLVEQPVDDILVDLVLEEPEHSLEDFESAAKMSFRGARPDSEEAWKKVLNRIRKIREDVEHDG